MNEVDLDASILTLKDILPFLLPLYVLGFCLIAFSKALYLLLGDVYMFCWEK